MTEIQFLISIILEHKLPEAVKLKLIARIGEVESKISQGVTQDTGAKNLMNAPAFHAVMGPTQQTPSTQRILNEMSQEPAPVVRPVPVPAVIDKETGRAIVATGNGTKGPRKF